MRDLIHILPFTLFEFKHIDFFYHIFIRTTHLPKIFLEKMMVFAFVCAYPSPSSEKRGKVRLFNLKPLTGNSRKKEREDDRYKIRDGGVRRIRRRILLKNTILPPVVSFTDLPWSTGLKGKGVAELWRKITQYNLENIDEEKYNSTGLFTLILCLSETS